MQNDTTITSASSLDTGTLRRGLQAVEENLHATIERVAEPVQQVVERASLGAHETVDRMAAGVNGAAHRLDDQLERVRAAPSHALDAARDYVAARPLKSIAVALAVGWLLGRSGGR